MAGQKFDQPEKDAEATDLDDTSFLRRRRRPRRNSCKSRCDPADRTATASIGVAAHTWAGKAESIIQLRGIGVLSRRKVRLAKRRAGHVLPPPASYGDLPPQALARTWRRCTKEDPMIQQRAACNQSTVTTVWTFASPCNAGPAFCLRPPALSEGLRCGVVAIVAAPPYHAAQGGPQVWAQSRLNPGNAWSMLGQGWPKLVKLGPNSTELAQIWSRPAQG